MMRKVLADPTQDQVLEVIHRVTLATTRDADSVKIVRAVWTRPDSNYACSAELDTC
jgi:hypothetical protein